MIDRYAVIGHPVAHSKSPAIHAAFARQTGEKMVYDRIEAPLQGFAESVADFFVQGGAGCNVTVPFKEEAFQFANTLTERARMAGAVNTLWLDDEGVVGDNTDGAGLLRDLARHGHLRGERVLLLGAGGAARGVLGPLLAAGPARLVVANRTLNRAEALATLCTPPAATVLQGVGLEEIEGPFDWVINATSTSLAGKALPLPGNCFAPGAIAYDMMYGQEETPFLAQARQSGAALRLDGLGMLVEQAAEAFFLWRGKRPDTAPVLAELRQPSSAASRV